MNNKNSEYNKLHEPYQAFYDYMLKQHNCTLLESEIKAIYSVVNSYLLNQIQEKDDTIKNLENNKLLLQQQYNNLLENVTANKGNYFVYNPKKDKPNKVYKQFDDAFADAERLARKEQEKIYILRIETVLTPKCSIDIKDVSTIGIEDKYMGWSL